MYIVTKMTAPRSMASSSAWESDMSNMDDEEDWDVDGVGGDTWDTFMTLGGGGGCVGDAGRLAPTASGAERAANDAGVSWTRGSPSPLPMVLNSRALTIKRPFHTPIWKIDVFSFHSLYTTRRWSPWSYPLKLMSEPSGRTKRMVSLDRCSGGYGSKWRSCMLSSLLK